jgi:hypothetical protein
MQGYHKYESLRHLFSHEPPYHSSTIELFTEEFGQYSFDYEKYDPANGFIVIDMTSKTNVQKLSKLARELMTSVKKIVGII